jgi:hypothetical protein
MRCLVIEDEADTARYISNGLRKAGAVQVGSIRAALSRTRKSGSQRTLRRRKPDSNSQSHPQERVSFGDKPTQIPKAMSLQTNGRRRP